jgi:hypothetical protein
MKYLLSSTPLAATILLSLANTTLAVPTGLDITSTIQDVSGSFVGNFVIGQTLSGSFIYDTDEANAGPGSITTPSTVSGHEFSSFYEFPDAPNSVSLSTPASPGFFTNTVAVAVVVNDNLPLTSGETGGVLSDGVYDWIEILGSSTVGICLLPGGGCAPNEFSPADGQEWTLAIFGDTDWFSDGSLVPDNLPATYSTLLVGFEFDAAGNEVGAVFATVDTLTTFTPAPTGDLDGDGFVGITDLNIVLGNWNQSVPPGNPLADPSDDGFVGIEDLNVILGNWNVGTPPPALGTDIPEPAALTLLTVGSITLFRRPRDH